MLYVDQGTIIFTIRNWLFLRSFNLSWWKKSSYFASMTVFRSFPKSWLFFQINQTVRIGSFVVRTRFRQRCRRILFLSVWRSASFCRSKSKDVFSLYRESIREFCSQNRGEVSNSSKISPVSATAAASHAKRGFFFTATTQAPCVWKKNFVFPECAPVHQLIFRALGLHLRKDGRWLDRD